MNNIITTNLLLANKFRTLQHDVIKLKEEIERDKIKLDKMIKSLNDKLYELGRLDERLCNQSIIKFKRKK